MKIEHFENGDMTLSTGSNSFITIFLILIALFFSKDAYMWVLNSENVQGIMTFAILAFAFILLFCRGLSLSSKFCFISAEKNINFKVKNLFSNKKGVVSIELIEKAILEEHSDGDSRIILKCYDKDIPMSSTMTSLGKHKSLAGEINEWLSKNKNT